MAPADQAAHRVLDRNGPVADGWVRLADGAAAGDGMSVLVSFSRLKNEHNALFAKAAGVGVEIAGDTPLEDLAPFLPRLGLIVVRFAAMRDGRPFSIGRLLRERYGFARELRAVGDFIPDQVLFLLRCGFNSFEVGPHFSSDALKRSVAAYTAWYQRGVERKATIAEMRRNETGESPPASKP
ncbi:MAG: DUF934 domain-containing protein [Rhodospirillaceae bacterium]